MGLCLSFNDILSNDKIKEVAQRWENDNVCIHDRRKGRDGQGVRGYPLGRKLGGGRIREERVKKNSYVTIINGS